MITKFLAEPFDERKLSIAAIKGYRSCWALCMFLFFQTFPLHVLWRNWWEFFENKTSMKVRSPLPSWNLVKTVEYLKGPMFEPLDKCDWRQLTKRRCFWLPLPQQKGRRVAGSFCISVVLERRCSSLVPTRICGKTENLKNTIPRSSLLKSLATKKKGPVVESLCSVQLGRSRYTFKI